jgi:hypothetical protein
VRSGPVSSAPAQAGPSIRLRSETSLASGTLIEVVGIPPNDLIALSGSNLSTDQWNALFAVYAEAPASGVAGEQPPVLGTHRVEGDALQFLPRFPLEKSLHYRAVFDPAQLPGREDPSPSANVGSRITATIVLPKAVSVASTTVTHVYPSREALPENHLKFYLHFSAPMSRGEAYSRVHLLKADGKPVELPFLELGEELWDPSGTRLTLLFSPGRIKKGLKPREELGPILEEGKAYTLVIDRDWLDAEGNPLVAEFRKSIKAGPADDEPPDPKTWKLDAPHAGTTDPLVLTFPEPLDHAMLERVLAVQDAQGKRIAGQIAVEADETRWRFSPESGWSAGTYRIVIDTALEDLAGNSIGRPFEVDAFHPIEQRVETHTVTMPFEVKPLAESGR